VPALDMEELLCTTARLAHEGNVMRTGMPRPLHLELFVRRFRREVRARSRPHRGARAAGAVRRPGAAPQHAERHAPAPAIA
jgi:hypothetical protein